MEAAYISNLCHKLWAKNRINAEHLMTIGYSGSWDANVCISCLSVAVVARSCDTACSTINFVVSDIGITPMCPLASV